MSIMINAYIGTMNDNGEFEMMPVKDVCAHMRKIFEDANRFENEFKDEGYSIQNGVKYAYTVDQDVDF